MDIQEIEVQWSLYHGFDVKLECKVRARIKRNVSYYGRFMPRASFGCKYQVMPPGMEFHHIVPQDGDMDGQAEGNEDNTVSPDPPIWSEVLIISLQSFQQTQSILTAEFCCP
ncbi:hypothetical protein GIB67_028822 [Kingdonia uniflora]|uniref:Uncharacterized protein n=1 Tax=Kingdonia uniflora TaxID=39325 RepID=A0A7J7LTC7_9MAGN|nr:hypothetical protein GIB67_028822 [Kingdonia uniflora]